MTWQEWLPAIVSVVVAVLPATALHLYSRLDRGTPLKNSVEVAKLVPSAPENLQPMFHAMNVRYIRDHVLRARLGRRFAITFTWFATTLVVLQLGKHYHKENLFLVLGAYPGLLTVGSWIALQRYSESAEWKSHRILVALEANALRDFASKNATAIQPAAKGKIDQMVNGWFERAFAKTSKTNRTIAWWLGLVVFVGAFYLSYRYS